MTWTIYITSGKFPSSPSPYYQPKTHQLSFSKSDLLWSAITVGRPNMNAVFQHGPWSIYEALFRWNLIFANLDFSNLNGPLAYSPAFHALDATEKAGVNFFLGMTFAKLIAYKQLGVPWLHHFDNFNITNRAVKLPGNSRPDFVGLHPDGSWHILEAKARARGFRQSVLDYGKKQARQVQTVDSVQPATAIGTLLFPFYGELCFQWEDPEPVKEGGIGLEETAAVWKSYYSLPMALAQLGGNLKAAFSTITGFEISMSNKISDAVQRLSEDPENWRNWRDNIVSWSSERVRLKSPTDYGDGLVITRFMAAS